MNNTVMTSVKPLLFKTISTVFADIKKKHLISFCVSRFQSRAKQDWKSEPKLVLLSMICGYSEVTSVVTFSLITWVYFLLG